MHLSKQIKSALSIGALSLFCAASLSAYQINITVNDKELDFPLEGVKVTVANSGDLATFTNEDGLASLEIPDSVKTGKVILTYPGYKTEEVNFKESQTEITTSLSMADVIEGKELVVERSAPGVSDEQSGVSVVIEKETFESTARMGLIEDVMSSVNTLPGISYGGTQPSVRGGYPRDTTAVMDGVYLLFPWQWGGICSIFDPGMVDSVKMSNGVFSARYGRALAGLLEVNTITPKEQKLSFTISTSDISTNAYLQLPFGEKAGMFAAGKVTYLDPLFALYKQIITEGEIADALNMIKVCPYIRNGYTKFYYNPTEKLNFTLSGFIGGDGIGYEGINEENEQKSTLSLDYSMLQAFTQLNAKWLPTEKLQFKGFLSYAFTNEDVAQNQTLSGKYKYNDDFINQYGFLLSPEAIASKSYNLPELKNSFSEVIKEHSIEGKLEGEYELNKTITLAAGADVMWSKSISKDTFNTWVERPSSNPYLPGFNHYDAVIQAEGNNMVNSAAYALMSFGSESSLVNGELGLRTDHFFISNKDDDLFLNSKPAFSPRGTIRYTPWRNQGIFDRVSFSGGVGLFSTIPVEMGLVTNAAGVDNCEMNKAVFSVLGTDIQLADDWNFKLEGYYRYYYSRLYMIEQYNANTGNVLYKNDGIGYSYGFDLMLQKKTGKWYDGYISYSFINAKFKNPTTPEFDNQVTMRGEPLNEWYYPEYHRFHTVNLVVNFHPTSHWDIMVKGTFASGTPLRETGDVFCYPVVMEDGTVIQRYSQHSWYSDTLRSQISCPVDLRVAYKFETRGGKLKWEIYGGAQDIFVNLYSPKAGSTFDAYTGETSDVPSSAGFNIGIPLINIGFKLTY
ncbi:TonB-dependent receptor [Treponema bryantii]|uniref:TonB-dependent receptor n=1 Tax=Treponema bryantii TaxID=163 RepID=UPI0003B6A604|nr:TonB-dependent receptor [Treponema bryantii]